MALSPFLRIDGSFGEGGGGLVRTALTVSAMIQQPVEIINVRAGTRFPGLDVEDVVLLRALAKATGTETSACNVGDHSITFHPNHRAKGISGKVGGERNVHGRTANGPITLTALIPALARSGMYSSILIEGETFGTNALGFDAFAEGALGVLREMGIYAFPEHQQVGFGRDSAGEIAIDIEPSVVNGLDWPDRGKLVAVRGRVSTAKVPESIAARALSHLEKLSKAANVPVEAEAVELEGAASGVHVTLWAVYERGLATGTSMGVKGLRVEALVQDAFDQLAEWMTSNATLDAYLADQILVPAAFADSGSVFRVSELTSRFMTAVWVIKQFVPARITVRGSEGGPGLVTIER